MSAQSQSCELAYTTGTPPAQYPLTADLRERVMSYSHASLQIASQKFWQPLHLHRRQHRWLFLTHVQFAVRQPFSHPHLKGFCFGKLSRDGRLGS